jgi:hypothetical protein
METWMFLSAANRDKNSRTFNKLRGVYQKDDLSQESNRFLAAKSERFCLYKNDSV